MDDNRHILSSLPLLLKHDFGRIGVLDHPEKVLPLLSEERFDLILLDMNYASGARDGEEGMYWLRKILQFDREALVVLMTAYGGVDLAVEGMKEGAADFVLKPWNPEKLISNLKNLLKLRKTESALDRFKTHLLQHTASGADGHPLYRLCSPPMKQLVATMVKVAPTGANILITGENGTGKELVAREIHRLSDRCNDIFVSADLGALSETLFESELFGHKKGSFTGAHEDRKGRFEIATGGTLFLDEIGNIALPLQAKLLSVLETRKVVPVGGFRPVDIDIRLISATNSRPDRMVAGGEFREDLFYRLNTIQLYIPPLRERVEDTEALCRHFLGLFSGKYRKKGLRLSGRAMQKLLRHSWPGNIRELKHTLERAVILAGGPVLGPGDFQFRPASQTISSDELNLQEVEKQTIARAVDVYQGNLSHAARKLGVTRATLYAKMKKYGI